MNSSPVTDADLHAFLDGELPPERHRAVEAWLAAHPDARRRLESFREQQRALRRMFAPVLDEPLPEALIEGQSASGSGAPGPPAPTLAAACRGGC
jgi:anti-sigma factor RsiW